MNENENEQIKSRKLLLPWGTRIFVHILCNVMILTAAFFIIVKGVDFGDVLVQKWLASLIVTLLTSIVLVQPLQVTISLVVCLIGFLEF